MDKEDFQTYKLRVPSQMEIATPTNIRKFIEILPMLPDRFENSDITNIKEYPINSDDSISRILSYFKYLDILTEERIKEKKGDKKISRQYFNITNKGRDLKETVIYEPNKLNNKWKQILKDTELYRALTRNEEFEKWNYISKTTLRKLLGESFTKKVKNIKGRVDEAEEYLIHFLKDADLFTYDGTYLKPIEGIEKKILSEEPTEITTLKKEAPEKTIEQEPTATPSEGFTYIKDDDFELKIRLNDLSLKLLEKQIEVLRIKLELMNKKQQNGEDNGKE